MNTFPQTSLKPLAILASLAMVSAISPNLCAQSQSKPPPAQVYSAAPARVYAPVVQNAANKSYWVGKAHDGSIIGVWSSMNPDNTESLVKFFISSTALCAVSSRENSSGGTMASAISVVAVNQAGARPGTARAFCESVGPENREKTWAHGALPVSLPAGLTRQLLELGASATVAREFQNLVEARNAGAALGAQSTPSADDPLLNRGGLPTDMRASPTAGLPGRDGRASDDKGDQVQYVGTSTTQASAPKDGDAPSQNPDTVKKDLEVIDSHESEVRHHTRQRDQGDDHQADDHAASDPAPSAAPAGPASDVFSYYDSAASFTPRAYGIPEGADKVIVIVNPHGFIAVRSHGPQNDPRRNPSEGGGTGEGIDSFTWQVIRGTGLGQLLYNNWIQKRNHDFAAQVRQPSRDNQVVSSTREVPKVGKSAVVNPADVSSHGGTTRRIPIKDPVKPDEGGSGGPVPTPLP